jgi:hypothetical protein
MGRTAFTEAQCLYNGALYLFLFQLTHDIHCKVYPYSVSALRTGDWSKLQASAPLLTKLYTGDQIKGGTGGDETRMGEREMNMGFFCW